MSIFRTASAAAGLLLSVCTSAVFAQAPMVQLAYPVHAGLGFVLEGAGEFGGDHIATVTFTDDSDQTVDAGDGVTISGGAHFHTESNWDFRGTVGYKYVTTKANNADIYVDRIVLKAVADYFFNSKWYVGGGIVHHSGIKFHGDDLGPDLDFDDATGGTIEAGWSFVALTYTFMDYQDEFGNKYNANNIGILFIGRF
ncbi:MAG: hypothetical protein JWQ90_2907 [Hydrocarboniphaga sp.]|uniref:hypothetical protein n=1 Tax=Hydrocarboniphaga sp. TaxID=2033016 RepID=UPI002611CE67|nr:hypothetical protein [Hydrocarboniphaga sp.]MDB5970457.1 hypothetical protein [Hydrocarboniphaga sp.]